MSNNKKVIISSLATVVAAGTIGVNVTSAHFSKNGALCDAIQKKDFVAFQNAANLNSSDAEATFEAIATAHELRKKGKTEKAHAVLSDAGIELMQDEEYNTTRADVRNALEDGNWDEFQEVVRGKKCVHIIDTKEKFDTLFEVCELRRNGRSVEAQEVLQDAGLDVRGSIFR
ncbi:MAG: hypothetical protein CR972_04425 [Candidatus Moraniibacteriota bacterium]|nr:MAG: hypothetical protein CR972_04425 [Candidatus Moranbacteria bacterium]